MSLAVMQHRVERIVRRHNQRNDALAEPFRPVDHRGHQLPIVGVQIDFRRRGRAAGGFHFGGHHDHVGRLRIGIGQRLFQHEQIVRRANRHQLAVRLEHAQRIAGDFVDFGAVELLLCSCFSPFKRRW